MSGLLLQINTQCEDEANGKNTLGMNVEMLGRRKGIG